MLAAVAVGLGVRLYRAGTGEGLRAQRLWAAAFLAGAVAALAGGIVHGFAASLTPAAHTVLWKTVLVGVGVASSLILAGTVRATLTGAWRKASLAGAAGQLAVYLVLVSASNDVRLAVWNVQREVAPLRGHALDRLAPRAAAGQLVDRRARGLVGGVVDERDRGRERVERRAATRSVSPGSSTVPERASAHHAKPAGGSRERQHAVAVLARHLEPARAVRRDEDRRRERARGREASRVEQPQRAPRRRRPPRRAAVRAARAAYSATALQASGGLPSRRRPVKPVPIAAATRPGASASSVAIAAACAATWRRLGTSTPGPSPIRRVASAIRASVIHTSG